MTVAAVMSRALVCSLGEHAASACAAARAGVQRTGELPRFVGAPDGDGSAQVVGHPVPVHTEGFDGAARVLQLLRAGLVALDRELGDVPADDGARPTVLYLALPDPARRHRTAALLPRGELRSELEESAAFELGAAFVQDLVDRGRALASWRSPLRVAGHAASGHTAFADVLQAALQDLAEGTHERVVVGAIDSLLTSTALDWLVSTHRLKTPVEPAGLMPGEAAVFFVLEPETAARRRAALGTVGPVRVATEPNAFGSGEAPTGRGLADLVGSAWPTEPRFVLGDQNGEPYRGSEWGAAATQIVRTLPALAHPPWLPAAAFGDTGAVSGALAVAMALHAFARRYAPGDAALVLSAADDGRRSAILVASPRPKEA